MRAKKDIKAAKQADKDKKVKGKKKSPPKQGKSSKMDAVKSNAAKTT